jgi:glycosyltransferase involved in cell wall biosynthesis
LDRESGLRIFSYAAVDETLCADLPEELVIQRIPCDGFTGLHASRHRSRLATLFNLDDPISNGWKHSLDRRLEKITRQYKPKLILASLPPFSAGPLAVRIAKRYGLRLAIDMRDGWSEWCRGAYLTPLHYYLRRRVENDTFRHADLIISVTEELKELFRRSNPNVDPRKFHVIPNGYDKELDWQPVPIPKLEDKHEYRIGYAGSFYFHPAMRKILNTPWW